MRKAINTVRGAVAKKDLVPLLTHLHFYEGRVQGSNGRITIDAPCTEVEFDMTVPMKPFLSAIDACEGEPELTRLENMVRVKSGRFKADIVTSVEVYPAIQPDANKKDCAQFLHALRQLEEFMGSDAQRQWSHGIYLNEGYALATNNIVLARSPVNFEGTINIPSATVDELLRIGKDPIALAYGENTATFYFDDGSWLRTTLLATDWPNVAPMLAPVPTEEIPPDLAGDIQRSATFADDKRKYVKLHPDGITTSADNKSAEIEGYSFPECFFAAEPLLSVLRVAKRINFSSYPKPCFFEGSEGLSGVIIGVRLQ